MTTGKVRTVRRGLIVLGSLVAAAVGLITNWLSDNWNWGLFAALLCVIIAGAIFLERSDTHDEHSSAKVVGGKATRKGASSISDDSAGPVAGLRIPSTLSTLPRDVGDFTGRDNEVDYLLGQVESAGTYPSRAIAIHAVDGMAGIGKTALAVHVAHQLSNRFDQVLFLDLRAHTEAQTPMEPLEALEVLLITLGVPGRQIPTQMAAREAKWRQEIAHRKALVILDNALSADQVRPLLPGTPDALVLITSRARLAALENVRSLTLETLPLDDATDLFRTIAGEDRADMDRSTVASVVKRCGCLPLAIRLAAGWLRHHPARTVEHLVRRLADTLGPVSSAFALSYRDLQAEDQRSFRHLVLHPGPDLTEESAAALTDLPVEQARRLLDRLYARHLVAEPLGYRYRFHDLIREYGRSLAGEHDPAAERTATVVRVFEYYLDVMMRAYARHDYTWLVAEAPNLVTCTEYAIAKPVTPYAWKLPHALSTYLGLRGLYGLARTMLEEALGSARAESQLAAEASLWADLGIMGKLGGDYPRAQANLDKALSIYAGIDDERSEAAILCELGALSSLTAQYATARKHLAKALEIFERLGDAAGTVEVLTNLGWLDRFLGDYDLAERHLQAGLALCTSAGDEDGQAYIHKNIAQLRLLTCEYHDAHGHLTMALHTYEKLGNQLEMAAAHRDLAVACVMVGDYREARGHLDEALRIYTKFGDQADQATIHHELGVLFVLIDMDELAKYHLETAVATYTQLGDRPAMAHAGRELAALLTLTGDTAAARPHYEAALQFYLDVGDQLGQANAHKDLGRFETICGNQRSAADHLSTSLGVYEQLGDRLGNATALHEIGVMHATFDGNAEAITALDAAVDAYEGINDRLGAANSLVDLAMVNRAVGHFDAARAHLGKAKAHYERIGDRLGAAEVDIELGEVEWQTGDRRAARKYWRRSRDRYEALGDSTAVEVGQMLRRWRPSGR